MLITRADIEADRDLPKKLKSWAASLNLSVKEGKTPTFKVSGPRTLQVRLRKQESIVIRRGALFTALSR